MVDRALIIGSSLTGKTTLVRYLRDTFSLDVKEIDEELKRLNGGSYPNDMDYKNKVLAPQIRQEVLNAERVIFFSNVHYYTPADVVAARQKGFKVVLLRVNRNELETRNKRRVENEGYADQSPWLDAQLEYQRAIEDAGLTDRMVETDRPVGDIAQELVTFLQD